MQGNNPSGSQPSKVYTSVWHRAFDKTFIRISPLFGAYTNISITSNACFGPTATAALHLISILFMINNIYLLFLFRSI